MKKRVFAAALAACCLARSASGQWEHLGGVTGVAQDQGSATLTCGPASLRVDCISPHVVRVRLAPDGRLEREHSWAVENTARRTAWESVHDDESVIRFKTSALTVEVTRRPCRLSISDARDQVLFAHEPSLGTAWRRPSVGPNAGDQFITRTWHRLGDNVAIYGLGEKTGPIDKHGQSYVMWNTDFWAYGPSDDPIYQSVPFFIMVDGDVFTGVFLDNPWRTHFDFGKEDRNVLSFGAEGGELDYYVIAGPKPKRVIERYTALTGRMELPPKWALGYHQCRYSYYPADRVREIAKTFREKRIPCDVIYFDIDYMDGYRCFTWSPEHFPEPGKLIDELHDDGFHTIAIIDPGIKKEPGYAVYDGGTRHDVWLKRPDDKPYVGRVWPGDSVFPDFTRAATREWWADLFPPFIEKCGIDGIWNDMNEPADFNGPNKTVPPDVVFDNAGRPAPHPACHNVYGMQMARATLEGLRRARPDKRPFTMTRATYAGGQRYGASWTGDNQSTWAHLQLSLVMLQNMGVSGMAFTGPDIGGFAFGATPELYARWIQVGSLFPYCRTHTGKGNPDQEPWSFGDEVEAVARESLERRYALLPYIYTLFEECHRTGVPIVRPLWLEGVERSRWRNESSFMLGDQLLVAPILSPGARDGHYTLPNGDWQDFYTGRSYTGGARAPMSAALSHLPLYVRAGAIIPMQSPVQHTGEVPVEPLVITAWPYKKSNGTLYEDDGATPAYRNGAFRRTVFSCNATDDTIQFDIETVSNGFRPPDKPPLLRMHGLLDPISGVDIVVGEGADAKRLEGQRVKSPAQVARPALFHHDAETGVCLIRLAKRGDTPQRVTVDRDTGNRAESTPSR